MTNPKNELIEFVQNIGYLANCIEYSILEQNVNIYRVQVAVSLNMEITIIHEGAASTKMQAQMGAARNALDNFQTFHPSFFIDWDKVINVDAQKGDLLIKLYAYLKDDLGSIGDKSIWLQDNESNKHLAKVFDRLKAKCHPDFAMFGNNLGWKHKADWIEFLLWKQFKTTGIHDLLKKNIENVEAILKG